MKMPVTTSPIPTPPKVDLMPIRRGAAALHDAIAAAERRPATVARLDRAIADARRELAAAEVIVATNRRHAVAGLAPDVSALRGDLARLEGERSELLAGPDPRAVALDLGRQLAEAIGPVDEAHGALVAEVREFVRGRLPGVTTELAALIRLLDAIGHTTFSRAVPDPLTGRWVDPPADGPLAELVRVADDFRLAIRGADRALDGLDRLGG